MALSLPFWKAHGLPKKALEHLVKWLPRQPLSVQVEWGEVLVKSDAMAAVADVLTCVERAGDVLAEGLVPHLEVLERALASAAQGAPSPSRRAAWEQMRLSLALRNPPVEQDRVSPAFSRPRM